MKPIPFEEQNCVYAKDQPEYLPLPAHKTEQGEVISCWQLSWREFFLFLRTRRIWLRQLTFNMPLQPQAPTIEFPFVKP
jgi:hypothetical protein